MKDRRIRSYTNLIWYDWTLRLVTGLKTRLFRWFFKDYLECQLYCIDDEIEKETDPMNWAFLKGEKFAYEKLVYIWGNTGNPPKSPDLTKVPDYLDKR